MRAGHNRKRTHAVHGSTCFVDSLFHEFLVCQADTDPVNLPIKGDSCQREDADDHRNTLDVVRQFARYLSCCPLVL